MDSRGSRFGGLKGRAAAPKMTIPSKNDSGEICVGAPLFGRWRPRRELSKGMDLLAHLIVVCS